MTAPMEYTLVEGPNVHLRRRREILKKHPEVRELIAPNPWSAVWIIALVVVQFAVGLGLTGQPWWLVILVAFLFGAFVNHALFVQTHECCHNAVFKKGWKNKVTGLICDFALVTPSALAFRKYHLMHHKYLGEYVMDPDIASEREAGLVGNSALMKALWLAFFSVSQGLRPMKIQQVDMMDKWIAANFLSQAVVISLTIYFLGFTALFYLLASTFFALGLHPVGGRWLQEHYVTKEGQETYSYYGILNKTCFNMGYHNEHHDFMSIPWNNLPKLKQLAPEYYDTLNSYKSWTWVLCNFIFNPKMSVFSRIVHPPKGRETPLTRSD
jgi:sphingolipid 4-desaturase/C4-monooxygenase